MLPSLFFQLAGCGLLLLFERTVHPWRYLGKEERHWDWEMLQGTKRGIEAEPTIWDQVISFPMLFNNEKAGGAKEM